MHSSCSVYSSSWGKVTIEPILRLDTIGWRTNRFSTSSVFAKWGKTDTAVLSFPKIIKSVKSDHILKFSCGLNNHILTATIFSLRSSPVPPIFKSIAVRSSPDLPESRFSSDPVMIGAHCLSLPNPKSEFKTCEKADSGGESHLIFGSSRSLHGLYKYHF